MFLIYHQYGHPWSVIFNGQFEEQEDKCEGNEDDIEETNIDADIMKDHTSGNLQAGKNETNIDIELVKRIEKDQYSNKKTEDIEETEKLIEIIQAEAIIENQSDSGDKNPKLQHSKCD